jgi:hypothetical protein
MPGAGTSDVLRSIDAVAAALVERAAPATIRLAAGPGDLEIAQRLRGTAVLDRGWAEPEALIDGRDADADDARAIHLLAFRDGRAVGTCRLLRPASGSDTWPADAAFLGRIVVIDPGGGRDRAVAAGLIGRAWLEARAAGCVRLAGSTTAGMLRLLSRMGFAVRVTGPAIRHAGEARFPMLFEPDAAAHAVLVARHGRPTAR